LYLVGYAAISLIWCHEINEIFTLSFPADRNLKHRNLLGLDD